MVASDAAPEAVTAVERDAVSTAAGLAAAATGTRYYTMVVRFRPFLFWMTRDDVGGARISWSGASVADRSVELLVGSDPETAPMSINRWGFISEQTDGGTARLTGVMTETDDQTIDAARSNPGAALANGHVFRAIRTTVRDNEATTAMSRMVLDKDFTYRHYAALLDRLPTEESVKRLQIAAGTDPGFLTAMKGLVHDSVEKWQATGGRATSTPGARREYVYMGKIYSLSLTSAPVVKGVTVEGRTYATAIDGTFEIRNKATGYTTPFEMVFGVEGAEREAPLRIVYRPRWWVELQLQMVDPSVSKMAMTMSGLSNPGLRR